jgi:hypothetical protein
MTSWLLCDFSYRNLVVHFVVFVKIFTPKNAILGYACGGRRNVMAVIDHIKIASAELLRAADLVKVEIENLRRQQTNMVRELDNRIADHLRQIRHFEHEFYQNNDPRQRSQVQVMIQRMQREVAEMRAEIRRQQQNLSNAIQQKTGMVSGLQSQARAILP